MSQYNPMIYSYRFKFGQLLDFLIGVGFLGIVVFLLQLPFKFDTLLWIVVILLTLLGLIPFVLSLNYWIRSFGVRISIDPNNELIEVMNHGRFSSFKFSELTSIEICEYESIGRFEFEFSFAKYSFADGKFCIATKYMTDQYFVPIGIVPRIYEEFIPLIWKKTNI